MSKETEKIFAQMHKYMEQFDFKDEAQMNDKIQEFMEKLNNGKIDYEDNPIFKSDDLLQEAYNTSSKTRAIKLAKQALEIYSNNMQNAL